jgi:hypothetical protein
MWIGERVPKSDPFFPTSLYNEKDETLPGFGCPLPNLTFLAFIPLVSPSLYQNSDFSRHIAP